MSLQPVQAVFFWQLAKANFSAAYGREPGGTSYSKDYLQVRQGVQAVMDEVLGRGDADEINVVYAWPGAERTDGEWRAKNSATDSRGELAWLKVNGPPAPWRVGDPDVQDEVVIPGDPAATTPAAADAVLSAIESSGIKPWLVAIKLYNDPRLHLRAYLEDVSKAPAGSAGMSTKKLPQSIQDGLASAPKASCGVVRFETESPPKAPGLLARIESALERSPNVLLVGPPGTGKTVALEDLEARFIQGSETVLFDPELWEDAWQVSPARGRKTVSVVFHSSYSYEQFVASLIPSAAGDGLHLKPEPGVLLSMAHWADTPDREALIVIDEFNRGPAAAIFGDTLALLDKGKRSIPGVSGSGASVQRPYPDDEMTVTEEYEASGSRAVRRDVRLPSSLKIVAALNSTDRSVAPLDAALRRRFAILYVGPDYDVLSDHFGISTPDFEAGFALGDNDPSEWSASDVKDFAVRLLKVLNSRIDAILGQDFLLGHALLWEVGGGDAAAAAQSLAHAFDENIAATLRLTFVDQDDALGAILKARAPTDAPGMGPAHWLKVPDGLERVAAPRLHVMDVSPLAWAKALRALRAIL